MPSPELRVLLIDSEAGRLDALTTQLREAFPEARVLTADRPEVGLELAFAEQPNVIFFDLSTSASRSLDLCRSLAADARTEGIPRVALTAAHTTPEHRREALALGVEVFACWPLDEVELEAMVRSMAKLQAASARGRDEAGALNALNRELISSVSRQRAEDAVREREFFFRESQRAASIGSYKADFVADRWESSEVLDQIFGIDASYVRDVAGWLDLVHPEERDRMSEYLTSLFVDKLDSFRHEYRIKRVSDGHIRWVLGLGKMEFSTTGEALSLIGTIQDISARKERECALMESEERSRRAPKGSPHSGSPFGVRKRVIPRRCDFV